MDRVNTIGELLDRLKKFPRDAKITVSTYDHSGGAITEVNCYPEELRVVLYCGYEDC